MSTCQGEKAGAAAEKDSGDLHRDCAPRSCVKGLGGDEQSPFSVLPPDLFYPSRRRDLKAPWEPQAADENTTLPALHDSAIIYAWPSARQLTQMNLGSFQGTHEDGPQHPCFTDEETKALEAHCY